MTNLKFHKPYFIILLLVSLITLSLLAFNEPQKNPVNDSYTSLYRNSILEFKKTGKELIEEIVLEEKNQWLDSNKILLKLYKARIKMKAADFWMRYLEPIAYKRINGPLRVEWETEVFEKFEKPYKREGAGLSLAELHLEEKNIYKDTLSSLVKRSLYAADVYLADSITTHLQTYHHFFLANRLFLLNLGAIYTTGFECPNPENIIPELGYMLEDVDQIYDAFDNSYPQFKVNKGYHSLYKQAISFVQSQSVNPEKFDHFRFIRDYVNPLFSFNQQMIRDYHVVSDNFNDYSLDNNSTSIFDKTLYKGQNEKGIYLPVDDETALNEIRQVGKLLFYDPVLSGNNKRSCASCHKPTEYFTDTSGAASLQFDNRQSLTRNSPSLINVLYNHLLMLDGKHTSLLNQAKDVVSNPIEMNGNSDEIVKKVLSCGTYEKAFRKFVKLTPNSKKISIDHIVSAVILYYSSFSKYQADFDDAMNKKKNLTEDAVKGFNIFMSKAQCGTCHFVPMFNGVKPPYTGSEFEVAGTPVDTLFTKLSPDIGRALINPAGEMMHAFRTGTIRNAAHTGPYMHNGIYKTLDEVIRFYDTGGGAGNGLKVINQTLSPDSLKLSSPEKKQLIAFIHSLDEQIQFETAPTSLPASNNKSLNTRKVGGEY